MGGTSVQRIPLASEESCLLSLLLREIGLETDPVKPGSFGQTNLGNAFVLTIIELAKESLFNLIDILNVHFFFFFLDVNNLQQGVSTRRLAILFHIAL